jgi:hypothetical protein
MGNEYGRSAVGTIGGSIKTTADGCPEAKVGGVTIDWSSVAAAGADATLEDSVQILAGEKYLRYGQVVCEITGGEITTLTVTAGSGNFTVVVNGQTATIAFDASGATIQAALRALSTVGGTNVTVTGTGPFTLTWAASLGDLTITAGGATVATTSQGARTGLYGPYDLAATDGRQTCTKGHCFILNGTVKENDLLSNHPEAIYGGLVFKERLIATAGTHSLANGPTYTELEAALPRLAYAA